MFVRHAFTCKNNDKGFIMDKRPNIILLMADQMRGDCLGIAGHPDVKTPFLDALAAEGVRYENAYSACPTCIPARATLYTGMSQEHTGRVGYEDLIPWEYPHTLAGELSKAGYYTQCVGKMHVHPLRNNLMIIIGGSNSSLAWMPTPWTPALTATAGSCAPGSTRKSTILPTGSPASAGISCAAVTARSRSF